MVGLVKKDNTFNKLESIIKKKERRRTYMRGYNKIYLKTKKGFIQRLYTKMKSRVSGTHGHNNHLYVGKGILDKEVFYKWMKNNKSFHKLFKLWRKGGYRRVEVPTIDRLDSTLGYIIGNIEVVTFSENMRRSNKKGATNGTNGQY